MSSCQERIDSNRAMWQEATWDDVATFIGPNAESYRDAFEETRQKVMDRGYGIARG